MLSAYFPIINILINENTKLFNLSLKQLIDKAGPVYVGLINDLSLFGSIPKTAWELGCDGNSLSNMVKTFDEAISDTLSNGFNLLINRQTANSSDDFIYFMDKIKNNIPFALIRPADGEYHILQNTSLTNIDNWTFNSNGKLHNDLNNAIHLASKKNCYIGIPCGCCNLNMAKWYISNFQLNPLYTTFANVFVNKNWKNWINFLLYEKISFYFFTAISILIETVISSAIF